MTWLLIYTSLAHDHQASKKRIFTKLYKVAFGDTNLLFSPNCLSLRHRKPISNPTNATAINNGGFETGDFTQWSTIGMTEIETADFGTEPSQGIYYILYPYMTEEKLIREIKQ